MNILGLFNRTDENYIELSSVVGPCKAVGPDPERRDIYAFKQMVICPLGNNCPYGYHRNLEETPICLKDGVLTRSELESPEAEIVEELLKGKL